MINLSEKDNIPFLLNKIKKTHFNNINDFSNLVTLTQSVLLEWKRVRDKFLRKMKANPKLSCNFEAEEDIVIGLISLLHEKFNDFTKIFQSNFYR